MEAYKSTLEERIASLESAFEEVKKLKGIPGARGPAGPIDAAVSNAERAAKEIVASRVEILRRELADLHKYIHEMIHNEVDAQVIQTLKDYQLLDEKNEPTHWNLRNPQA